MRGETTLLRVRLARDPWGAASGEVGRPGCPARRGAHGGLLRLRGTPAGAHHHGTRSGPVPWGGLRGVRVPTGAPRHAGMAKKNVRRPETAVKVKAFPA